jgi:flavin reductase (DIM6/NTAB) family NADH-FMN oxidoreductase RutF
MNFKIINTSEFNENAIKIIGEEWMLITAGTNNHYNTMTAAWGGIGFLWKEPMATIFIRPQRYTYEFVEQYEDFTLCFFEKEHHKALQFCGTKSGRDYDKAKETGLTPQLTEQGNVYFEEARLVVECKKVYYDDIKPELMIDKSIDKLYPAKDYHRMYIGFITNIMIKE